MAECTWRMDSGEAEGTYSYNCLVLLRSLQQCASKKVVQFGNNRVACYVIVSRRFVVTMFVRGFYMIIVIARNILEVKYH